MDLPEVREGSGGSRSGLGRGQVALLEVRKTLLEVWENLPEVREGSVGPPGGSGDPLAGPAWVGRPLQRSGRGREALLKVLEGLGGSRRGPGEVRKASRRSTRGREALQEVQEWSRCPSGVPGGVGRPSQRFGRPSCRSGMGQEALAEFR